MRPAPEASRSGRAALLAVALATIACTACGTRLWPRPDPALADPSIAAVGLVTEGSAFARTSLREEVRVALEEATHRRVVLVEPPARTGDALKAVVARLAKETPALARCDAREPQCAGDLVVLTALEANVDAVYRVAVDRVERSRPAQASELPSPSGEVTKTVLGPFKQFGTVREEAVTGSVTLYEFVAAPGSQRAPVARAVAHLEPTIFTPRLDIAAVVSQTIRILPPPRAPRWDACARRLIASGCPLLALAVDEARLKDTREHRSVRAAALAAIGRQPGSTDPKHLARETSAKLQSAIQSGDLDEAAAIVARYEASPARRAATLAELRRTLEAARARAPEPEAPSGANDDRFSCSSLCGMHMIEICNNDKVLWNHYRRKWEATPCGTMRQEDFLTECYRQQWLTGTFHDSCLVPCESTPEGRDRLLNILQGAGCLRGGSS